MISITPSPKNNFLALYVFVIEVTGLNKTILSYKGD